MIHQALRRTIRAGQSAQFAGAGQRAGSVHLAEKLCSKRWLRRRVSSVQGRISRVSSPPLSAVLADGGAAAFLAAAPAFAVLADGGAAAGHALMFASAVRAFLLLPSPLRLRCCWPCRHVSRCWPLLATAPSFSASANLTAKRRVLVLQLRNFLLEHGDVLSAWPALVGLGHAQVFCRTCTR